MHIRSTERATESLTPYPTVAAASAIVATWNELTAVQRGNMISALQTLARLAGLPPGAVYATPERIRALLDKSAPALGLARGTRGNLRSRLTAVLRRIGCLPAVPPPPSPAWQALLDRLTGKLGKLRAALTGLARYCTARDIEPPGVNEIVLAAYKTHLLMHSLGSDARQRVSAVRLSWNRAARAISSWPTPVIPHLPKPDHYAKPLSAFPLSFQADFNSFFARLAEPVDKAKRFDFLRPDAAGIVQSPIGKPHRPASVTTRRDHTRWGASALVAGGLPIEQVVDLATLVALENAWRIAGFLYGRAGNQTTPTIAHIAEMLRIIAKYHVGVPDEHLMKLQALARELKVEYKGMTAKNERTVRAAMDPVREEKLLALPGVLFAAAEALFADSPKAAALLAMRGLAIEILLRIPLRLANVQGLRLDYHLHRADPRGQRITAILISRHETKDDDPIAVSVEPSLADMMQRWIKRFRPHIAAPDCVYLFPGQGTGNKPVTPQALREAIKDVTGRYVGVVISPHQFRHLAARRYLDAFPGQIASVSEMLGHSSLQTTRRCYLGADQNGALRVQDEIIRRKRQGTRHKPLDKTPRTPRKLLRGK